jgi:hypothetical protein
MFKRGIGHVEAILSFLLFIGFVSTALFFFVPSGGEQIIDSTLYSAVNSILANTTVDYESYSVKIFRDQIPQGQNVVAIEFPPEISPLNPNYKTRAETYEGKNLPATRGGNFVYVQPGNEQFIIIKFSEDIQQGPSVNERPAENPMFYKVASSSKRKIATEQRIIALNNSYYKDYEKLKSALAIPGQISFGFSFILPNITIVAQREIPAGLEVFSSVSRRELLLQRDGALVFGEVGVKVW